MFEVVQSSSAYEQFTSGIGLGELLEKPEGQNIVADAPIESYTIVCKNRTFAREVPFSYESVQDAKKGNLIEGTVSSWGPKVALTKDKFYAKFFNNGALTAGHDVFNNSIQGVITDASGSVIYDSQPFFDTAHADKVGNSYANYTASRALTQANLETTWLTYTTTNNRDERGDPIELEPDVLLIPPALKFTAQVILNTALIPGSQDNDTNVMAAIVEPMQWSQLTDPDGWFLGVKKAGLMATDREGVNLDFYRDDKNLDYYARIFVRFGGCVTQWRLKNQCLPTLRNVENNRVNCWEVQNLDNQQPSLSNVISLVDRKVQRLMDEDITTNNSNTSALLSIAV